MIPAAHAVRSALLLKMLGKSRRSHVMDLVFDQGVALAAGLNAIPKTTYMAQYSSRLGRKAIVRLLGSWVEVLREEKLIDASSFNLDFHSIAYFGDDPFVVKHYVPRRSQRRKAVLTFFAQDAEGQVFCYSNADLRKGEEAHEVLRFVEFWRKKYGETPRHLVFDSKLTTYEKLSQLNQMGITFITLRRRSAALAAEVATMSRSAWKTIRLDVPHRKFKTPRAVDQRVSLKGYLGKPATSVDSRPWPRGPDHLAHQRQELQAQTDHYSLCPAHAGGERSERRRRLLPPRCALLRRGPQRRLRCSPDRPRGWNLRHVCQDAPRL